MTGRRGLVAIPADRCDRARRRLRRLVSRRVSPASVLALVEAAADALAEGRLGAAPDLLSAICLPERVEGVLLDLLDDDARLSPLADRGAVA